MKTSINAFGSTVEIELVTQEYQNGRVAIQAIDLSDHCPWGTMTVNVPEVPLADDEIIVKTYSENEQWVPQVLENLKEHFEPTGRSVSSGHVTMPVYRFKAA